MKHKSIRKFLDVTISMQFLKLMVTAGQSAASSSFFQDVTIIRVTDQEKSQKLASISGNQERVRSAGEFFIFCADLNR